MEIKLNKGDELQITVGCQSFFIAEYDNFPLISACNSHIYIDNYGDFIVKGKLDVTKKVIEEDHKKNVCVSRDGIKVTEGINNGIYINGNHFTKEELIAKLDIEI